MQGTAEKSIIEKRLEVEENACQVLQEVMEKGNKMVFFLQSKEEMRKLMKKIKEDLQRREKYLEKTLFFEGEIDAAQIMVKKEKCLNELKRIAIQRRSLVLKELWDVVFNDF